MKIIKLFVPVLFAFLLTTQPALIKAQNSEVALTSAAKKSIVDSIANALNKNYVFADTARRMGQYIENRLEKGAYDTIKSPAAFAKILTADVWSVYHDGHFSVRYAPEMTERLLKPDNENASAESLRRTKFGRSINYGFAKAEVLDGNIGYIKLDGFWGVEKESKQAVMAALSFVSHCRVLVFDLTENHGGNPDMVTYIAGFLFRDKTHLNDLYIRNTHQLNTYWTSPDYSFSHLYDVPVYILTSKTTFSAGEEFTYDLQTQKRATVVGETTGGGAHPVGPNLAGYGFVVNIPFARAINPITKTNWEGTGVKPDIETPADKALATALDKIRSAQK
jgi:hypothetical protein